MREAQELHEATEEYYAQPLEVRREAIAGLRFVAHPVLKIRVDCRTTCLSGTLPFADLQSPSLKVVSTMAV